MSCTRKAAFTLSLLCGAATQLLGWGQSVEPIHLQTAPAPSLPSFPLNQDQAWYVKESYLLWHPSTDDIDWATRVNVNTTEFPVEASVRIKKPDFGWYSGGRFAFGRYLPNHDHWDVSLIGTVFYANAEDSSSPNAAKGQLLQSAWVTDAPSTGFNKGSAHWRLNFFTADVALGRIVTISSRVTAHPFVTVRGLFLYEHDAASLSFRDTAIPAVSGDRKFKFKGYNHFWGVGPRIGSDFTFYMNSWWTLMGSLSGTLALGGYQVREDMRLNSLLSHTFNQFKAADHGFAVRGMLEGSLGMGWEKWVRDNTVRIAPSIVVEAAQVYDVNQRMTLGNLATVTGGTPNNFTFSKRHGDLTLWGLNFNLQVDF